MFHAIVTAVSDIPVWSSSNTGYIIPANEFSIPITQKCTCSASFSRDIMQYKIGTILPFCIILILYFILFRIKIKLSVNPSPYLSCFLVEIFLCSYIMSLNQILYF
jgi:hypothetical protein